MFSIVITPVIVILYTSNGYSEIVNKLGQKKDNGLSCLLYEYVHYILLLVLGLGVED